MIFYLTIFYQSIYPVSEGVEGSECSTDSLTARFINHEDIKEKYNLQVRPTAGCKTHNPANVRRGVGFMGFAPRVSAIHFFFGSKF